MTGMRFTPKGYGGERRAPDQVKRDGWKEQGLLAVHSMINGSPGPSGSWCASSERSCTASVRRPGHDRVDA